MSVTADNCHHRLLTNMSKGETELKRNFHCTICAKSDLSISCLTVLSWLNRLVHVHEMLVLIASVSNGVSGKLSCVCSLVRASSARINKEVM